MNIDLFLEKTAREIDRKLAEAKSEKPRTGPTGPRTPEGKAASSRNALKHGLTSRQVVIKGESQEEFDALLQQVIQDRQPVGALESELTTEIAACAWRLNRARNQEAHLLETDRGLFERVSAPGFERLLRYMGSIERQFHRAIAKLQQLQAERRKLEAQRPAEPAPVQPATTPKPEFVSSATPTTTAAQPAAARTEPAPHASPGL